jgi:hypothetical protein
METLSSRRNYVRGFSALPRSARIAIVVSTLLILAGLGFMLKMELNQYVLGNGFLRPLLDVANGRTDEIPQLTPQLLNILLWLLLLLVISIADTIVNIAVLVLATRRKLYPPAQDRTVWLVGLWTAFIVVQLPTGIPSALLYWWFVARPAKNIIPTDSREELPA